MRVLVVADVLGGVRTFARELTAALRDRAVEVDLALLGPADAAAPLADAGAVSFAVRDLRLEWMDEPWADVGATGEWIAELCDRHRPDLVHMNTFAPVPGPELPVLLTFHSCVLTWWRAVHGREAPSSWERYRRLVRAALDRADLVVVPTQALARATGEVYGQFAPARVIPNGRRVSVPHVPRERLVVAAGRIWDQAKNVALLAAAAGWVDGRVLAVGPGETGGVENVGPLGERELLRRFAAAAVFAAPARYEPFGLTALEAALCGCALVLGDIPSLREVWSDAASYVSPDDPEALASAVNALLDDSRLRERMAARARATAARYTPTTMAAAYTAAYEQLLRSPVIV